MKINEFINYFNNVKAINENEYMALCPAHNDKNPSLSIGYSKTKVKYCFIATLVVKLKMFYIA